MLGLRLGGRLHVAVAAFTASQHYNHPQMLVQMFVMLAMLEYIQKSLYIYSQFCGRRAGGTGRRWYIETKLRT